MKILIVKIESALHEKAIFAVLDALKLDYSIKADYKIRDETKRIMDNSYLIQKLDQGRNDVAMGKGIKIASEDIWK